MLRFDLPVTSCRWVGRGRRRRLMGARQTRKLLLLRDSVIEDVKRYCEERGGIFFNHAVEELIAFGLKLYDHYKTRRNRREEAG